MAEKNAWANGFIDSQHKPNTDPRREVILITDKSMSNAQEYTAVIRHLNVQLTVELTTRLPLGKLAMIKVSSVSSTQRSLLVPQVLTLKEAFFFSSRRRHTRYWRDWSSDVCSSD